MWKGIGFVFLLTHLSMVSVSLCIASTDHLNVLKEKYPYGILGEDFGILNEEDLAINTCNAYPAPFPTSDAYPYWQCFKTKDAITDCEDQGYDESEKSVLAIFGIDIRNGNKFHTYNTRRAIPMKGCQEFRKSFAELTKKQEYFCISGPFPITEKKPSGEIEISWFFDKFKTKKGCESYFEGACDFKFQLKHGCKSSAGTKKDG